MTTSPGDAAGSIVAAASGQLTASATLIAIESNSNVNDAAVNQACLVPAALGGTNISTDDSCGFEVASGDTININALADNGGPTPTRLPGVDSILLDRVSPLECVVDVDQRGTVRPQRANCDVGAVEVEFEDEFDDEVEDETGASPAEPGGSIAATGFPFAFGPILLLAGSLLGAGAGATLLGSRLRNATRNLAPRSTGNAQRNRYRRGGR